MDDALELGGATLILSYLVSLKILGVRTGRRDEGVGLRLHLHPGSARGTPPPPTCQPVFPATAKQLSKQVDHEFMMTSGSLWSRQWIFHAFLTLHLRRHISHIIHMKFIRVCLMHINSY
jgi:hypothetical protein